MELPAAIKRIMETGKVELGTNSTLSGISDGKVRLVVLASNCPKAAKRDIERYAGLGSVPVATGPRSSSASFAASRSSLPRLA
jgi:ribosomal protein L30E